MKARTVRKAVDAAAAGRIDDWVHAFLSSGIGSNPLIAEYRGPGSLSLHDGSHRHKVLRQRGAATIWTLIWCNSESDFVIAKPIYDGRSGSEKHP